MSVAALADALVALVIKRDHVTFVEAERELAQDGAPCSGDVVIAASSDPHLVVWAGMSQEFADAVELARAGGRLHFVPTQHLTYLIDGQVLTLPLAQRPPDRGYRTPHWLPVVMRPGPAAAPERGHR